MAVLWQPDYTSAQASSEEFDPQNNVLIPELEAGSGITETTHAPNADAIAVFGDSVLYVPRSQGGARWSGRVLACARARPRRAGAE